MSVSVYTVANERFFPGLIGLVSSLRVNGHTGPIVVVDSGLASAQVNALSQEATIVRSPSDLSSLYLKPFGPLQHPDEVMLFIDADMLCVRPLDEIIERVRGGSIVVFEDPGRPGYSETTRSEWEARLELGPLVPGPYSNGGFFGLKRDAGVSFFTTFAECLDRVDPRETHIGVADVDFELPFFFLDQDIGNAILASKAYRADTVVLPYHCAPHPPFRGLRVTGELSCADDSGASPYFLHHALQKPWLEPLPNNPYTELLVRYLHHPTAPTVDDHLLPRFLRAGRSADWSRAVRAGRGEVRARVRGKLGLRPYLARKARQLRRDPSS
jgi:hypothetical protein